MFRLWKPIQETHKTHQQRSSLVVRQPQKQNIAYKQVYFQCLKSSLLLACLLVCSFSFFLSFFFTSQMHIVVAACTYFHFLISFRLPILSNGFDCLIACRLNVSNLNWFQTGKYVSIYRSNDWDFQPDVATTTNLSNFRWKNWQKSRLFFWVERKLDICKTCKQFGNKQEQNDRPKRKQNSFSVERNFT